MSLKQRYIVRIENLTQGKIMNVIVFADNNIDALDEADKLIHNSEQYEVVEVIPYPS